ncbi:MAG: acyltransferase, partial [Burkholderiaceae bacterium]
MQTSDGADRVDRATASRPDDGDRDTTDWIDAAAGLGTGSPLREIRQRRAKVVAATQASLDVLLDPALPDLSLLERCAVAVLSCVLTPAPTLAVRYRSALARTGADAELEAAIASGDPTRTDEPRLRAILTFTRTLIERPVDGDRAALLALPRAGLTTPAVVALAQWIAFLSYQARVVAGLKAMDSPAAAADSAI